MKTIRPITLVIEKHIWDKWKYTVPREQTLNEALVGLIEDDINYKEDDQKKRGKKK